MESKAHALIAGLFVMGVAALLVLLALWLLRDDVARRSYEMVSSKAVTGLQVQAAVRYKGVTIGKVSSIGFDPQSPRDVLVTIAVDSDAPITRSTFATIASQGLTGLAFVQLNDLEESDEKPLAGPNGAPRIPLQPGDLEQLGDQARKLIDQISNVVGRINEVVSPDNVAALGHALVAIGAAADEANALTRSANEILRAQLGPERTDIPALVRQTTSTMESAQELAGDARKLVAQATAVVAEVRQSLQRMNGKDGMLQQIGDGASTVNHSTLPRIHALSDEASRTLRRLDRLARTIDDNPQVLLYGSGKPAPGPGEPGFAAPGAAGGSR